MSFVSLLFVLATSVPAHALKTDPDQPINVRARSIETNEKTGVTVYRGDVVLTQGSVRIHADRVEAVMRAERLQKVHAVGKPVRLRARADSGEELRASAQRADYLASQRQIVLHGRVVLERDKDVVKGETVRYHLDTQAFSAEGGSDGRVSAVIQPAKP